MGELITVQANKSRDATAAASFWKSALGLMVRFMLDRPTFYESASFDDLVGIADRLGEISLQSRDDTDVLSALYVQFSGVMLR